MGCLLCRQGGNWGDAGVPTGRARDARGMRESGDGRRLRRVSNSACYAGKEVTGRVRDARGMRESGDGWCLQ